MFEPTSKPALRVERRAPDAPLSGYFEGIDADVVATPPVPWPAFWKKSSRNIGPTHAGEDKPGIRGSV
jgi:hypothetical protein